MWRVIRRCSRVCEGSREIMCAGRGPRCVIRNIYKEYPAVIRVPAPVKISVQGDQLNRDEIIISSPIRLGRGGSARFARLLMNHHVAMRGSMVCIPRARTIVRLWVRS